MKTRAPSPRAAKLCCSPPHAPRVVRTATNELQEEAGGGGGCGLVAGPSPPRRGVRTRGRACAHAKLWKFPF